MRSTSPWTGGAGGRFVGVRCRTNGMVSSWTNRPSGPRTGSSSKPGKKFGQLERGELPDRGHERIEREHVIEIDQQFVVLIGDEHPAWDAALRAPSLYGCVAVPIPSRRDVLDLLGGDVPIRTRENGPAVADPRQKRLLLERMPRPLQPAAYALRLQAAENAIRGQIAEDEIVRGGETRQHAAAQARGVEHDLRPFDRDQQIVERNLAAGGRAADAKVGNLPIAQHGARVDVADPSRTDVHHLGEHRVGIERLFRAQLPGNQARNLRVSMAEASGQACARRAEGGPTQTRKSPAASASSPAPPTMATA